LGGKEEGGGRSSQKGKKAREGITVRNIFSKKEKGKKKGKANWLKGVPEGKKRGGVRANILNYFRGGRKKKKRKDF